MSGNIKFQSFVWTCAFLLALLLICSIESRNLEHDDDDDNDDDIEGFAKRSELPIPFNLEEIYRGYYYAEQFNGTWISSDEFLYENRYLGEISTFNVATGKITHILSVDNLNECGQSCLYELSADRSQLLVGHSPKAKFRHTHYRKYSTYNFKTRETHEIANGADIILAKWSPVGNSLIYEYNNDLYYRQTNANGTSRVRRLTNDGIVDIIYNGLLDWVYEEEVMGTGSAVWFSPDGKYLAFASLNDTEVQYASYLYYGEPGNIKFQYPKEIRIKYPKAGTKNPKVSLNIVDLANSDSKLVSLESPIEVVGTDHILYTVVWLTNETVAAMWTNRVQNIAELVSYNVEGRRNDLLRLEEKKGWLEIQQTILTFRGMKVFLTKYQETNTMDGRYNHVTSYDLTNGNSLTNERDLSPFSTAVQSILKIDTRRERIYYLATSPGEPSQRNLYSVRVDGKERPTCISCSVLTPEGSNCTYASASFSEDASYYILTCSGPDPTFVEIYNGEHKRMASWQKNEMLRRKLKKRLAVTSRTVSVRVNGYFSRARMILPPGFNEKHVYPMIVQVYAGPNSAAIRDSSSYGFSSYYTTNRSVIWTVIDGRGSAYRGSEMLFEIYRGLGTVEIEDQIAVTKKLQEMYPWIDSNRTGIWGWSYGGYATAMVLATDDEKIFKCGISVAPVSSWIYYDSIYTERYMGLPTEEDNLAGYNRSDVTRLVDGMRGKKYMLIHGTGDDNVHYQQSMALAGSLERADIQFEQISYPDEAHGLVSVTPHLAHSLDHFWGDCLELRYAN